MDNNKEGWKQGKEVRRAVGWGTVRGKTENSTWTTIKKDIQY